ncbi:translation elongation factor Ts [Lactobacillus corticis]|uniref:Elongation factor Ts n=1 Tax=Lactobacillus corticis TaxID=2201249 RepID=A0A916VIE3_9LACO|nr:translation elongation factor Ts [Lactobacillus corticis]GFZ27208.1 translation elongation factor Ts [Lactobacillus corticis]
MATITARQVKELREKTGAGVMDAKKALVEVDGDMDKAIEYLHEKGMAKAAKKADRVAAEGLTGVYESGNTAAIVEVNSETDFVAQNEKFVNLVKEAAKAIAEGKPANQEEADELPMGNGMTLKQAFVDATATIGEKIVLRRFAVVEKTDDQEFGAYQHNGGQIGVISVLEGGDAAMAKQIAMHIAAMKPTVISPKELAPDFVKEQLALLNHKIDQDNESRALVNKPALPHLVYGSESQLTDEVIAKAKEDIKKELADEGKPEKIWDRIIPGKLARFVSDNTQVDKQFAALSQEYIMDDSKTVGEFLKDNNAKLVNFVRYEVGEGIEKKQEDFAAEVREQMK